MKAYINYPSLSFTPSTVNFGDISNGSQTYQTILLKNISPFSVAYKWELLKNELIVTKYMRMSNEEQSRYSQSSLFNQEEVEEIECCIDDDEYDILDHIMYPILDRYNNNNIVCDEIDLLNSNLKQQSKENENIEDMITIIPSEGCIPPYESNFTYFKFNPQLSNSHNVRGTALCHILCGEEERVPIEAMCTKLSYCLETTDVNFGIQVRLCLDKIIY